MAQLRTRQAINRTCVRGSVKGGPHVLFGLRIGLREHLQETHYDGSGGVILLTVWVVKAVVSCRFSFEGFH